MITKTLSFGSPPPLAHKALNYEVTYTWVSKLTSVSTIVASIVVVAFKSTLRLVVSSAINDVTCIGESIVPLLS